MKVRLQPPKRKKCRNVAAVDGDGNTPLHYAAGFNEDPESVAVLIENGADVNAKDDDISYACRLDDGDLRMTILRLLNPDNDVTPYNVEKSSQALLAEFS